MCAIAGYYLQRNAPTGDVPNIHAMIDTLIHRGPDDSGVYCSGEVALAHRRLAIIDLTAAGHQPMSFDEGRCWIVFNGEIYNYRELRRELESCGHRFKSDSDTEVILHAYKRWGDECVNHFNGMWAFAIWDMERHRLFCSRDRFGVKPFYYSIGGGAFVFASEPKAILQALPDTRRLNHSALHKFLTEGVLFDGTESFFEAIKCLLPAHNLVADRSGVRISRYWDYPTSNLSDIKKDAAIERFRELFFDSVRLRSRSDVEIGTTLSGGLDSTSILAVFRRLFPEQAHRTFSAVFDDPECDESDYILSAVAEYEVESIIVRPREYEFPTVISDVVRALDSPVLSPATFALWKVMESVRNSGIKVMFDGQGADELIAGYDQQCIPPYVASIFRDRKVATSAEIAHTIRNDIRPWVRMERLPWLARYFVPSTETLYRRMTGISDVLSDDFAGHVRTKTSRQDQRYTEPLNSYLYHIHSHQILPGLLHYGDAISMAFSVEYRVPFLDYRLVEYCFGLKYDLKISEGYTKAILREALKGILLEKVRLRRTKFGFNTPVAKWLCSKRNDFVHDVLFSRTSKERGVFNLRKVQSAIDRARSNPRVGNHLLRWLITELWMKICLDETSLRPREPAVVAN